MNLNELFETDYWTDKHKQLSDEPPKELLPRTIIKEPNLGSEPNIHDTYMQLANNVIKLIDKYCQPWIKEGGKDIPLTVYRGVKSIPSDVGFVFKQKVRIDRLPKDSTRGQHLTFQKIIHDIYNLTADRTNSIFVSGSSSLASIYGKIFAVFPIGEFNYTWSTTTKDWYSVRNWKKFYPENTFVDYSGWDKEEDPAQKQNFNNLALNVEKVKERFALKGDDNSLREAVYKEHEILIHSKEVMYINFIFMQDYVTPVLLGKEPKWSKTRIPI